MKENTIKITREMLTDKIDAEYANLEPGKSESINLFAYRRDSMGHIRNALYNTPIADELLGVAHGRENVLREAYLFWTEKAAQGDTVIDKDELALHCVRLWLGDVYNEHRHDLLYERASAEYAEFMAEERLKTPDEIIEDAWKITCYNDLMTTLANAEIDTRSIAALLTLRCPLSWIYEEYLSKDMSDHMDDLLDTAMEVAQLQKENISQGYLPQEILDERYISEYLECYGNLPADEDAEWGDNGMEP